MENKFSKHGARFEQRITKNGIRVLCLPVEGRNSLTVGVWVKAGSAYEQNYELGIGHFAEHISFKGTKSYSAKDISLEIESRGGSIDAYTAREEICFYATVLGEDIEAAVHVLGDIVSHPLLRKADIEIERKVICSEIDEIYDDPEQLAQDVFPILLFGQTSPGMPIAGSKKTVSQIDKQMLLEHRAKNFFGKNILVGAAGNFSPEVLVALVEKFFSMPEDSMSARHYLPHNDGMAGKLCLIEQNSSQVHFYLGTKTFPFANPNRYALAILDTVLGRTSSSRLFQNIREKKGLVYNVASFGEYYSECGFWLCYSSCARANFNKVYAETLAQLAEMCDEVLPQQEFDNAKNFLRKRLLLAQESLWNELTRAVEGIQHFGYVMPREESEQNIMQVTREDVRQLAETLFAPNSMVGLAFGDIGKVKVQKDFLETQKCSLNEIWEFFEK